MRPIFAALLASLSTLIIYNYFKNKLIKRRRNAEATRRGCEPPPLLRSMGFDPTGLRRLVDNLRAVKEDRGPQYIVKSINEVGEHVHTIRVHVLDYEVLVTRDPENVKAMFATQAQDFDIGSFRTQNWKPLLGVGIFTLQGEAWRHSRSLVRPQFSNEQISNLDLEERHVQALLGKLEPRENGWTNIVDLGPLFYNFTLDTATEFLYGHSVHSQNPTGHTSLPKIEGVENPNQAGFGPHIDGAKEWIYTKGILGKWNWLVYSKEFTNHCKEVHKYVDWFVQLRLRSEAKHNAYTEAAENKQKFVLLNELAKTTQDPLALRNETLQLLNAGRDTTGTLLGWIFYFLARHPHVYAKLRAIVLAEFGTDSDRIEFAKLRQCQYLHHCINEAFRMVAVVPLNERVASHDTTLPQGGGIDGSKPIFLTKGTRVLISTYAMQHRPDIWGDDVEEFKPERWESRKSGWEFIPFGGGPRKCLGRKFLTHPTPPGYLRAL